MLLLLGSTSNWWLCPKAPETWSEVLGFLAFGCPQMIHGNIVVRIAEPHAGYPQNDPWGTQKTPK